MSRIGKKPVPVPKGVDVSVKGAAVRVKGPKGVLNWDMPAGISAEVKGDTVEVKRASDVRELRALHGLSRNLVNNMVVGVSQGFEKRLNIIGVGYSVRAEGRNLILNVGFCQPKTVPIPEGIEVEIPKRTNNMIITGPDKQQLGQFAADLRAIRPPEPYKGKGIRYEDEFVRRKAGKSVVGGGA